MALKVASVVVPVIALLVLAAAWIKGGREPVRDIVEPLALPAAAVAGGAR